MNTLSNELIEVEELVRDAMQRYFRVGEKFVGSIGYADRLIGKTAKARKSLVWLVCERMMYAKITEHSFRTDRLDKIVSIDGRA